MLPWRGSRQQKTRLPGPIRPPPRAGGADFRRGVAREVQALVGVFRYRPREPSSKPLKSVQCSSSFSPRPGSRSSRSSSRSARSPLAATPSSHRPRHARTDGCFAPACGSGTTLWQVVTRSRRPACPRARQRPAPRPAQTRSIAAGRAPAPAPDSAGATPLGRDPQAATRSSFRAHSRCRAAP